MHKKYVFDYHPKLYPQNINFEKGKTIKFNEVFEKIMFFNDSDYKNEFAKFNKSFKHMNRFIWRYKDLKWYEVDISIFELLNVFMCPVGWLRRFACINNKCANFKNQDCIKCKNKNMQIFTLKDVLLGFEKKQTKFSDKIYDIKKRIDKDISKANFLFCTLVQNKYGKFFVMDGNSRLLAYALHYFDNEKFFETITCYIGERM